MAKKNHIPDWLTGVLPVLPTPFTPQDEVEYPDLQTLVDFAAKCGVKTVVTPAFGSEFYKLDGSERQRVIETAVAQASKRKLRVCVNFRMATLEEAGIGTTIRTVALETGGRVGVLSGWGGVLNNAIVRPVTVELDADATGYPDLFAEQLLEVLKIKTNI